MQAYATAARTPQATELSALQLLPTQGSPVPSIPGGAVIDQLLFRIADLVADKVVARLGAVREEEDRWFDTRDAAEYLGIHRDRLRRLAAEGSIPVEQGGAGCKLYFRRSELDAWRCPGASAVVSMGGRRHG